MAEIKEFKGREPKELKTYVLRNDEGTLVATVKCHGMGIDVDAGIIMFFDEDADEAVAIAPLSLILTLEKN